MGKVIFWGLVAISVFGTLLCGVYALLGWIVMALWNLVVGHGFDGPFLSFWDGTGLVVVLSLAALYLTFGVRRRKTV